MKHVPRQNAAVVVGAVDTAAGAVVVVGAVATVAVVAAAVIAVTAAIAGKNKPRVCTQGAPIPSGRCNPLQRILHGRSAPNAEFILTHRG